jgi:hypothetical protein
MSSQDKIATGHEFFSEVARFLQDVPHCVQVAVCDAWGVGGLYVMSKLMEEQQYAYPLGHTGWKYGQFGGPNPAAHHRYCLKLRDRYSDRKLVIPYVRNMTESHIARLDKAVERHWDNFVKGEWDLISHTDMQRLRHCMSFYPEKVL